MSKGEYETRGGTLKDIQIDESIFLKHHKTDIHRRGKSCVRTINGIKSNQLMTRQKTAQAPHRLKQTRVLTENNKELLLQYAQDMAKEVQERERSLASFEKNLSEAWLFLLAWNKDLNKETLTRDQMVVWWEETKKPYHEWLKQNDSNKKVKA